MLKIKSHEEIVIYESPDGGKTVYSRKSGSSDRTMIKEDTTQNYMTKWYEWKEILKKNHLKNIALLVYYEIRKLCKLLITKN